jgi:hypothetical protein
VLPERLSEDAALLGEHLAVALPKLPQQPGRAFDVREQEGDRSALELTRKASPTPRHEHRAPFRLCQR